MDLSPLRITDIQLGLPLPWPVYDQNRKLLLREGFVVESARQLDHLIQSGLYRHRNRPVNEAYVDGPGKAAVKGRRAVPDAPGRQPRELREEHLITFADTGLEIGTPIQLQDGDNAGTEKFYVRLIGCMERKSIVVSHPTVDGQLAFVKEGTGFRCRAFQGKNAYAFDASVIRPQLLPYPYLHLEYPGMVRGSTVRKAYRIKTDIIASVGPVASTTGNACTIRDMSLTGFLLQSPEQIATVGEHVHVAFRISIEDEPSLFELEAVVRNNSSAQSDSGRPTVRFGVELVALPIDQRRLLELYIYRNLLSGI